MNTRKMKQKTLMVVTKLKEIKNKLDQLAGTDNEFEIIFLPGSTNKFIQEPGQNPSLAIKQNPMVRKKNDQDFSSKGYELKFKRSKDEHMISNNSIFFIPESVKKITIEKSDGGDKKLVAIFHC